MRIIAGAKKGMSLFTPKTMVSRPITDRVKESLFDVLYNYDLPEGKIVADLFCGVGSLGLEALSRGAEFVAFVEKDHKIIEILNRNIEKAGFVKESKVVRANAFKTGVPPAAAAEISNPSASLRTGLKFQISDFKGYDLVFVDPPYADTKNVKKDSPLGRLLDILSGQVTTDGIVVVRTDSRIFLMEHYGCFQMIDRRLWGSMAVTILRVEKHDE
jgi:16S rRNA (guanine966-N2)-methyltransferase